MRTDDVINGKIKTFQFIRINVYEFKVVIFENHIKEGEFNVSLQPTGTDGGLPEYKLSKNTSGVSNQIIETIPKLSNWLINSLENNHHQI